MSNVVSFEEKRKQYPIKSAHDMLTGIKMDDNPSEAMIQIRKNMRARMMLEKKMAEARKQTVDNHKRCRW